MQTKQSHIGGTFAPPLSDEKLSEYKSLIDGLSNSSPVKYAMQQLHNCCAKWWDLPESSETETKNHSSGIGIIVPLETEIAKALWDHIPWAHEIEAIKILFEEISNDTHKPLRDAAFHLLWHVIELNLDREPLTVDKL